MKLFNKVAIIGVGLIGGSIGMAIRNKHLAKEVVGVCRRHKSLKLAMEKGAIDKGSLDIQKAVSGADLVILATPILSMPNLIKIALNSLKKGCILTDVGSTKAQITRTVESIIPGSIKFVGTHPMAGSEKSGVSSADPRLFCGAICIIVKTKNTNKVALNRIKLLWQRLGAKIKILSPALHDKIISITSHLPHLVSANLILSVPDKNLGFAATGFRDTTRIALSDPDMWVDICLSNRREILGALDRYSDNLKILRNAIKMNNRKKLFAILKKAKDKRLKLNR